MLSFSISCWDLIKFPYFADISERGDRGWKNAQRQGEDKVTLLIILFNRSFCQYRWKMHVLKTFAWTITLGKHKNRTTFNVAQIQKFLFFFFQIVWGSRSGNHHIAKFGYTSDSKAKKKRKKRKGILVTCWKLLSKCDNFRFFFIKVWQNWDIFSPKNPFVGIASWFFFFFKIYVGKWQKFTTKTDVG